MEFNLKFTFSNVEYLLNFSDYVFATSVWLGTLLLKDYRKIVRVLSCSERF